MYMHIDLKNRISYLIRPVYTVIEQSHLEYIYLLRSVHKVVLLRFSFGQDCIHTYVRITVSIAERFYVENRRNRYE